MAFQNSAKPTKANIRRRAAAILDAAESLETLATHWDPKGRYFKTQRDLITVSRRIQRELKPLHAKLNHGPSR